MRTRVPRHRPHPLQALCARLVLTPPAAPLAVGVSHLASGSPRLHLCPLAGNDVVAELSGLTASADWDAFGIVANASARRLDDDGAPEPVTVAVLASRAGVTAHAITGLSPDGDVEGGEGRLVDACRRVLGLATAPPDQCTRWWSVLDWVDRVLDAALGADLGEPPPWPVVLRLDRGADLAGAPWSAVRARCATGRLVLPATTAAAAAWMDDGMFSREVVTAYPPLLASLGDLAALLPATTFDRLLDALASRLTGC
jgi:hypothetical protein